MSTTKAAAMLHEATNACRSLFARSARDAPKQYAVEAICKLLLWLWCAEGRTCCCPKQAALEAVTATHQLNASIDALAKCARPMLLARSFTPRGRGDEGGAEQACRLCTATLPALACCKPSCLVHPDSKGPVLVPSAWVEDSRATGRQPGHACMLVLKLQQVCPSDCSRLVVRQLAPSETPGRESVLCMHGNK
jgi:hypothetical protein